MNLQLHFMVCATSTMLGACASAPLQEASLVYVPTLERLCFDRDGDGERGREAGFGLTSVGRPPTGNDGNASGTSPYRSPAPACYAAGLRHATCRSQMTSTCYLMPPAEEGSTNLTVTRPEETVWSRVTETVQGHTRQYVAHGRNKQEVAGNVRLQLGSDGRITEGSIIGHFALSWRWDADHSGLAQLDLLWPDRQVTVTGRRSQALRVQVGLGGSRFWESTVTASPEGQAKATEAWIADGRLDVPFPDGTGEMGIFPICPLGDREVWDDWNGRFPRVMRCLRDDAEWLRLERDGRGRIVTVAEKRVRGVDGAVGSEGEGSFERTIRIAWHDRGMVPERIWVEVDARKDGLEASFSPRGVPEMTRQYRRGQIDGLAVIWHKARARGARMYAEGSAMELELVTRWTEGQKSGGPPELKFGLEADEAILSAGETGLVWPQ